MFLKLKEEYRELLLTSFAEEKERVTLKKQNKGPGGIRTHDLLFTRQAL